MTFRFLFFLLLAAKFALAQVEPPVNYKLDKDVVYERAGDWEGRLDIYKPSFVDKKVPLVVFIHGGGWVHGRKEDEKDFSIFFEKGFVVANIEYRLANQAVAPAAIEDCHCALTYLINRSEELGIDRKRIVLMGVSAGAHLALMTGFTIHANKFNADCEEFKTTKFKVAAIIDRSGPTDLNRWETIRKAGKASSTWLGGKENDTVFVNTLSPITYINKKTPPVFIIHGEKDRTVPYQQALTLLNYLKKACVVTEFSSLKEAGHSISEKDKQELKGKIFLFLKRVGVI